MWQIRRSMTPDCFSAASCLCPAQDKRNVICLYRTQTIRLVRHLHTTRKSVCRRQQRKRLLGIHAAPSEEQGARFGFDINSARDVRRVVRLLRNADSKTLGHGLQHVNADASSGDHIEFRKSEVRPATRVVLAPAQRICAKRLRR